MSLKSSNDLHTAILTMACWQKITTCSSRSLLSFFPVRSQNIRHLTVLQEVGRFETPETLGTYAPGQFFVHKTFGYRGVVLFSWNARLYDRTHNVKSTTVTDRFPNETKNGNGSAGGAGMELQYEPVTFYNTLIDRGDRPYVRIKNDFVRAASAFCMGEENRNYIIPGLDHVGHSDILPYASSQLLDHELDDKFFTYPSKEKTPQSCLVPSDSLLQLGEESNKWLDGTDVDSEVTEGIRVTIIPFFVGLKAGNAGSGVSSFSGSDSGEVYWWRYCVRLENLTNEPVHLREHHLRLFSVTGKLHTQHGRGVVGDEPRLYPDQPAFQYCSYVSLDSRSGNMWGSYQVQRENGTTFEVRIPPCSLEVSV